MGTLGESAHGLPEGLDPGGIEPRGSRGVEQEQARKLLVKWEHLFALQQPGSWERHP